MSNIPDLWADDIKVDALAPEMLLIVQAESIKRRTQALVLGDLTGRQMGDMLSIMFDLLAPAAHNFRHRLMIVRHRIEQVYPVTISSACFNGHEKAGQLPLDFKIPAVELPLSVAAYTSDEFVDLLGEALRSPYVKSVIDSLIARSNVLSRGWRSSIPIEIMSEDSSEESVMKGS